MIRQDRRLRAFRAARALACTVGMLFVLGAAAAHSADKAAAPAMPNILFLISDDQSWVHTGVGRDGSVKTPHFDRIAREGVRFTNAYCCSPGCAPSRGSILSGQAFWRLREGAIQRSSFPGDIAVYPDALIKAGYHVGLQGKGWGPGKAEGRKQNPAGPKYPGFAKFLASVPPGAPFCFWFGSLDPHRPYDPALKRSKGPNDPSKAVVPPFLPDVPEVRDDLLDYYAEIERFDREVGEILALLDRSGKAADTLVFVTSDNGMPFPRAKTNLYDYGVRMPLAVRWPARVPANRVVDDFVTLADCAPTILEAAGLEPLPRMTARSFLDVLRSDKSGRVDPSRDHVVVGRERHGTSWPCRALRSDRYLYIRNFVPERIDGLVADNSPSKDFLTAHATDPSYKRFYDLAFGPRPGEELYDVQRDPAQVDNLAARPDQAETLARLRRQLEEDLRRGEDPRILGHGDQFDNYPDARAAKVPSGRGG